MKGVEGKEGRSNETVCLVWDEGSDKFYIRNFDNLKLIMTWEFLGEGAKLSSYNDISSSTLSGCASVNDSLSQYPILNLVHCLKLFKTLENTTFRKPVLLPSSSKRRSKKKGNCDREISAVI
jgi:hypothetical protein